MAPLILYLLAAEVGSGVGNLLLLVLFLKLDDHPSIDVTLLELNRSSSFIIISHDKPVIQIVVYFLYFRNGTELQMRMQSINLNNANP